MSIRKALGAVKDQATIGIAKVSSAVAPDLDVAIVRATAHDDGPPDERHVQEVLRLTSGSSRIHVAACVATVSRRLARTRDYVVAAKCLALLHRLVADGDPHFRHELVRPAVSMGRRGGGAPVLAALSDFRDEAHSASWDHSAFVRAYALYLDDRVRFLLALLPAPRTVRFADDGYGYGGRAGGASPPPDMTVSVHDMDVEGLLARGQQLRQLIDRFLACRPTGAARRSRVVLATLWPVVKESARLYEDVAVVLAVLLDRFFDMEYPDCVKAFEAHVSTARLVDDLLAFYSWCDDAGVARSSDLPEVKRIDDKLLETLEQFVRERGRAVQNSPPPRQLQHAVQEASPSEDEHHQAEYDMNGIKALPAPEHVKAATVARPEPAKASAAPVSRAPDQTTDLVDLRESVAGADEQGNKLALALFSEQPQSANSSWVAFPSDDSAPKATTTSAWQTPAAEPGKADWELALVETASNLSRQTAALGGGMDPLLLHGMYDQGAVRHHARAQAASGSASSVALPGAPAAHNILALPGPDGAVGGDPFAASLSVPPPSYVQMAEMERKQELLAQEQRMWAQYRQGGLNGLAVGGGGSAFASSTSVPMPMAYHGAGGYYY
ncbi:putative clathrin assembly protein At2g25430 [Triticum urartu]|uniref:ENTH domain-containing protein n=1 Tax=Triticum urartu TaxID=4572 RepID=A0A8R7JV58_TRIUA|nr:putative clathrin assembly protein At2g25430 [Triticum urartu]XP_048563473.1 putative clathrin assembly protein At2g25430 [Triticum urartu]